MTGRLATAWLLEQLQSTSSDERQAAVVALREVAIVPEVEMALRVATRDDDGHVRFLSAEALARSGLAADVAIPVLVTVLNVGDEPSFANRPHAKEWRRMAAGVLGRYGERAAPAIDALRRALWDPEYNVRGYAALSLGKIGTAAMSALQDLRAARQTEGNEALRQIFEDAIGAIVQSEHFIVITPPKENTQ